LNTNRSNHLIYKESIIRIWNTILPKENLIFKAGLRAKYINLCYTLTSNSTNKDNYLSLFPSFSITNLDNNQYKFSYSRRIQRPRYLFFKSITSILTYNVSVGNPDLTPQFTDAFELVWIKKKNIGFFYANFSKTKCNKL
jgi:outer membrane receptor protein involved in Fe transport